MSVDPTKCPIAVVGMSGRFPGASSVDEFWDNIIHGRESITRFTNDELRAAGVAESLYRRPNYVGAKGIVAEAEEFDAALFGYSPREAKRMDPQLRLLHTCAWEGLEDAGYRPRSGQPKIGLYVGVNENYGWVERVTAGGDLDAFLLCHRDYAATRVAHALRMRGPALTVLTACSTSLVAVHLACQALRDDACEMALAGGISLTYPLKSGYLHEEGLMHSSDGVCRTFAADASGTVFGDGAGIVVLKRLDRALADGDTVRAVIRGSAINNDGDRKVGFTAPSVAGQREVIAAALEDADTASETIGYVEAHGTATQMGDPIEVEALTAAFATDRRGFCAIGSVKTNIGHVNVAAGASALIKTVKVLETGQIPAHLHFDAPNPAVDFSATPFYVPTELNSWERGAAPRRAGISGFGFGGTNAHVVVEEAGPAVPTGPGRQHCIFTVSAHTEAALDRSTRRLCTTLDAEDAVPAQPADIAFTLAVGREPLRYRSAVVAESVAEAKEKLIHAPAVTTPGRIPRVAFVFPGQGSQYLGMGRGLYESEASFRKPFDECCAVLRPLLGGELRDVVFGADAKVLARTRWAQPAIFAVSYALAQMWTEWVGSPDAVLGHSVGEIAAACVAGVFDLETALRLVALRAELMDQLPPGGMLAVATSGDELPDLPRALSVAAYNAPRLCVVSGPVAEIERFAARLKAARVPATRLQTSHAFHSSMMQPAGARLAAIVDDLAKTPAAIPLVSTVTGHVAASADLNSTRHWVANLLSPVRFAEAVVSTTAAVPAHDGAWTWIEVGPGTTLNSLVRASLGRDGRTAVISTLPDGASPEAETGGLARALAEVWKSGVEVDWDRYHAGQRRARTRLPSYPFEGRTFAVPSFPAPTSASGGAPRLDKLAGVAAWLHVPSWRRTPHVGAVPAAAASEPWLVLADDRPLWLAVLDELRSLGAEVVVARRGTRFARESQGQFRLRAGEADDYRRMLEELATDGFEPTRVIHAWSEAVAGDDQATVVPTDELASQAFFGLLGLAQALGNRPARDDVLVTVVTSASQAVGELEAVDVNQAVVGGPVRVISQEYANVQCLQLDLDAASDFAAESEQARLVVAEACAQRGDVVVAHRAGTRWSRAFEPLPLTADPTRTRPFRDGGTYLVTGGLGGLGLAFAGAIASMASADLILTGRSHLPARNEWDRLLAESDAEGASVREKIAAVVSIEATGARVHLVQADVCDEAQMRSALDRVCGLTGPVDGVIHAAGIPGEGIIQLKDPAAARPILAPKIKGTLVLERIFADQPLDFVVLCSSIASVLGGIGLVDYSAANHFLDAFAQDRKSLPWRRLVSINWDMWGEVGMGLQTEMPEELQEWFKDELAAGLTSAEGVEVLQRVLADTEQTQIVVSTRDLEARIELWLKRKIVREREEASEQRRAEPRFERPELSAGFSAPEGALEARIAEVWADLFEIKRVGRHDNFFELGGHSLLAAVMLTMLGKRVDVRVPISAVAEHPTVAELASFCREPKAGTDIAAVAPASVNA